jgi:hypothetical protein
MVRFKTQPTLDESNLILPDPATFLAADRKIEVRLDQAAQEVSSGLIQSTRSYQVAIAQIATYPGQIDLNTDKIIASITEAKRRGAELIVFPNSQFPVIAQWIYSSIKATYNRTSWR